MSKSVKVFLKKSADILLNAGGIEDSSNLFGPSPFFAHQLSSDAAKLKFRGKEYEISISSTMNKCLSQGASI